MNCNNIRKYFYAFIDGELNVERNIEILAHLDMCYECSKKVETERTLQKIVKETVCKTKAPDSLKQKLLKQVETRPSMISFLKNMLFSKNRLIPIGVIATVLILVVSFFSIFINVEKENPFSTVESRYHDILTKSTAADIRSGDNNAIIKYLQDKTNLDITLPKINENAKLIGASLSTVNNIDIPLVFYTINNIPTLLYIISNDSFDFSKMKQETINNSIIYSLNGLCGTCKIIGWKSNKNQYIMVSKLERDEMIGLVTKV